MVEDGTIVTIAPRVRPTIRHLPREDGEVTISGRDVTDVPGAIHAKELSQDSTINMNAHQHSMGTDGSLREKVGNRSISVIDVDPGEHPGLFATDQCYGTRRGGSDKGRRAARLEPILEPIFCGLEPKTRDTDHDSEEEKPREVIAEPRFDIH